MSQPVADAFDLYVWMAPCGHTCIYKLNEAKVSNSTKLLLNIFKQEKLDALGLVLSRLVLYSLLDCHWATPDALIEYMTRWVGSDPPLPPHPKGPKPLRLSMEPLAPLVDRIRKSSTNGGGKLHFLLKEISLKRPRQEVDDREADTQLHEWEERRKFIAAGEAPSQQAMPGNFIRRQSSKYPMYNGRPPTRLGPSLTLFFRAFGEFKDTLADKGDDSRFAGEDLDWAMDLLLTASDVYPTKDARQQAMEPAIQGLLRRGMSKLQGDDNSTLDGVIVVRSCGRDFPVLGADLKLDLVGSCDPSFQLAIALEKYWAQMKMQDVAAVSCCPTVLLSLQDNHLQVYAMVHTDVTVVEPLTESIELRYGHTMHESAMRVCHLFSCLRHLLDGLETHYLDLRLPRLPLTDSSFEPRRCLPRHTQFQGTDHNKHTIVYEKTLPGRLSSRQLFLGQLDGVDGKDGKPVLIKFTERYGRAAHEHAAKLGFAPTLHGCERIQGGLVMAVMDYVHGTTLQDLVKGGSPVDPKKIEEQCRGAIRALHDAGYVFGDVRAANLMLDSAGDIKIIDWDMAGKQNETRWPANLNMDEAIGWPAGVAKNAPMLVDQDDKTMEKLIRHVREWSSVSETSSRC